MSREIMGARDIYSSFARLSEYCARMTAASEMLIRDFELSLVFDSESENALEYGQPEASGVPDGLHDQFDTVMQSLDFLSYGKCEAPSIVRKVRP
jgi:hypothetical protein